MEDTLAYKAASLWLSKYDVKGKDYGSEGLNEWVKTQHPVWYTIRHLSKYFGDYSGAEVKFLASPDKPITIYQSYTPQGKVQFRAYTAAKRMLPVTGSTPEEFAEALYRYFPESRIIPTLGKVFQEQYNSYLRREESRKGEWDWDFRNWSSERRVSTYKEIEGKLRNSNWEREEFSQISPEGKLARYQSALWKAMSEEERAKAKED